MAPRRIPGERITTLKPPVFTRERLADIKPTFADPLLEGILPRTGVAFFAGPSTSCKTFLALEIGLRISREETVDGRATCQAGVMYIGAEDAEGIRHRIFAWTKLNGDHGHFQLIPEAPDLQNPASVAALVDEILAAAGEMSAAKIGLGFVVVDTISKAAPGADQNASSDMGEVMSVLERVARQLGILILVLAHTPKDETRGIAGWYGQFAAADAVVMCSRDSSDPALRTATVAKFKNGRDGDRLAFRLKEVPIGKTPKGKSVSSCVVVFEDASNVPPKGKKPPKLGKFAIVTLNAVAYIYDHGATQPAPALAGVPRHARAVRVRDVREWALKTGLAEDAEKDSAVRMRWLRALAELIAAGKIRQHGDALWMTQPRHAQHIS